MIKLINGLTIRETKELEYLKEIVTKEKDSFRADCMEVRILELEKRRSERLK